MRRQAAASIRTDGVFMKLFGLGVPELLIILAVILLIFGPKNLPKLGSALGKTVKNLKEGMGAGKKEAAATEPAADEVVIESVEDPEPAKAESQPAEGSAPKTVRKVVVKKKAE